ncbi:MAG: hypothetical protein AB7F88_06550 [Pyrinomonadaceae bacterium]
MAEERNETEQVKEAEQSNVVRSWLIRIGILVLAFVLGFLPMWCSKRNVTAELDQTKRELSRGQLQNMLSTAVVYSRRGEYEIGRQNASNFFTELQSEVNKAESSILTADERSRVPELLSGRDDVITLLSRGDPAAADRLSDLYVAYRAITGAAPLK